MLQISLLKNNPEWVKERLILKCFKDTGIVDEILIIDEKRRKAKSELEDIQSKINTNSKAIGGLMAQGKKDEVEKIKVEVSQLKENISELSQKVDYYEKELNDKLILLPNLPNPIVPEGKLPKDNVIIKEGGIIPDLGNNNIPHWEILEKYDLVNFELGNKITGSGFPVYKGQGARLQHALIQYFLHFNTDAGYTEYIPPFMVNAESAYATGQLPDKEGQMYFVNEDNLYLIPTAEVPVTNIYRDTIVKQSELPIKMTAYSPCFRREAGSYGKEVRGLNRVHQFEKVEIIQLVEPEKSNQVLIEMVDHVEKLLISLNLPYRILLLCGGDMGFASAITYDFEVYSTAQKLWLEVSSVSNFESFQSNRLKCRYKNTDGKINLVHTLNGSSLALPRIIASLLENNQKENKIEIPSSLVPFFGKSEIVLPTNK